MVGRAPLHNTCPVYTMDGGDVPARPARHKMAAIMQTTTRNTDWLLRPRWIIPGIPVGTVLQDHALQISDGRIHAVVPATTAAPHDHTLELPGHVLLPGLVNAHTHAAMALFRGLADDLPLQRWLKAHIWPLEQRCVAPDFVQAGTRLAIAEMLRGGTTCFNDMYFFPQDTAAVARAAGIRAVIGAPILEFQTPWAEDAADCLTQAEALLQEYQDSPRLSITLCPHAPYSVADASFRRIHALATTHGLRVHTHLHETATEVADSLRQYGMRPLQRLHRLGLVNERLIAVHATQLEPAEIRQLADSGAGVVHCPESNLKLASGLCPVQALLNAAVPVALGTDSAASNNNLDLLAELHTAALLGKLSPPDCTALAAADALHTATLGGAKVLGLADRIGSLEPGKCADLIAIDLRHPHTQPVYNPISQLVYAATANQVSHVWVDGRLLLREGHLQSLDVDAVLATAADWGQRITTACSAMPSSD